MKLLFVGDVHGQMNELRRLSYRYQDKHPDTTIIPVGDLEVGIRHSNFVSRGLPRLPENVRFIRGNHDNPRMCAQMPSYLGDYGFCPESKMFWVGGAWSIDKHHRTEGKNWWPEEELGEAQMEKAFALYRATLPAIVVTHECPPSIFLRLPKLPFPQMIKTRTTDLLERMFAFHQPKLWVFGHHHLSWRGTEGKTFFVGLDKMEACRVDSDHLG